MSFRYHVRVEVFFSNGRLLTVFYLVSDLCLDGSLTSVWFLFGKIFKAFVSETLNFMAISYNFIVKVEDFRV